MSWFVHYRVALTKPLTGEDERRLAAHNARWFDEPSEFSGGYGLAGKTGTKELSGESQPSGDRHWIHDALVIVRALLEAETEFGGEAFIEDPTGGQEGWLQVRTLDLEVLRERLSEQWAEVDRGLDEGGEFEGDGGAEPWSLPATLPPAEDPDSPLEQTLRQARDDFARWKNRSSS
jgi:hypothetical protein